MFKDLKAMKIAPLSSRNSYSFTFMIQDTCDF